MRTMTALICVISAAVLFGCGTSGTGPEFQPVEPADYHERLTVEDVFHNIVTAYEYMEAAPYLDCLAEDFEFFPTEEDVQNPELEIPPVWWKPDERELHENMFDDDSNVERISLTLTISNIIYDYGNPEDDTDDTCVCVVDVDLRVILLGDVILLANAQSEYNMRIDVDQWSTEPETEGDNLWEIHEWWDLDSGRRGADSSPVESSSWGGIKSLYR